MYLKGVHIENNGPLRTLVLDLPFNADGTPKPVVLVGSNGSGKTNFLSIVADALFEAAAQHYQDVVPSTSGLHRPWFRVVGASTISAGVAGGFSLLRFEHDGTIHSFREKAGIMDPAEASARVLADFRPMVVWPKEGNLKEFLITDEQAKAVFEGGVYAYFPSSRAESPHWLNRNSLPETGFDLEPAFAKRLRRPIYVERGLEPLKQWLLALLLDARADVGWVQSAEGSWEISFLGDPRPAIVHKKIWMLMNFVLQRILGTDDAHLVWLGRHGFGRLAVEACGSLVAPTLDALSAGQAILLSVFGTLIRYADTVKCNPFTLGDITGICLIDEIDAHMHIDLQHKALPELMRLFPRVQFIVSAHSPFFAFGMEQVFGSAGLAVIELPSGTVIDAESYAEFGRALEVVRETKAFTREIADAVGKQGKILVMVEGETDPVYYRAALEMLGRAELLDQIEINWIGAKDPKGGQGYNTGYKGLNNAFNFIRANPGMVMRHILFLYDNDCNKPDYTCNNIFVRTVPGEQANSRVKSGIERLLPDCVFIQKMYDVREKHDENGNETTIRQLNKQRLCDYVCKERRIPADFQAFVPFLDMLDEVYRAAKAA